MCSMYWIFIVLFILKTIGSCRFNYPVFQMREPRLKESWLLARVYKASQW